MVLVGSRGRVNDLWSRTLLRVKELDTIRVPPMGVCGSASDSSYGASHAGIFEVEAAMAKKSSRYRNRHVKQLKFDSDI